MATAVVVASAVLLALVLGRIDGAEAAHARFGTMQSLPPWGWALAGFALAEATTILARYFRRDKIVHAPARRANASPPVASQPYSVTLHD